MFSQIYHKEQRGKASLKKRPCQDFPPGRV